MSTPLPGTYRLRNVQYPNQLFDLQNGSFKPGTPVIGYANNTDTQNMLWTMQVVDAGNRTVRLINVASGTFAHVAGSGSGVVGDPSAAQMQITPRNHLGEYAIQTTDGQLSCSLSNNDNYTQVTIQQADGNDDKQGWIFCPA